MYILTEIVHSVKVTERAEKIVLESGASEKYASK